MLKVQKFYFMKKGGTTLKSVLYVKDVFFVKKERGRIIKARYIEKISFEQWQKDIGKDKEVYEKHELPKRQTKYSAGYDFKSPIETTLQPGEIKKIPLGVKVTMNNDEMLMLVVRSSMGFKYNIRMTNQVGIFESDYYNNETNEGHAWISLQNHGTEDYKIKIGDRIGQGIFTKFLIVDNEEPIEMKRKGGVGSTN